MCLKKKKKVSWNPQLQYYYYNAKISEIEGKIPSITGLATTAALTMVENKIPNVSYLAKKMDYYAKISDIEKKYFTTSDYNKFTRDILEKRDQLDRL